jgi:hypothetical protein
LYGYNEVIQSLTWGLTALGHTVTYAQNKYVEGSKNIIFGVQMASWPVLNALPEGSIIYNLEQYYKHSLSDDGKDVFEFLVRRFEIWDYSDDNILLWNKHGPGYPVSRVPIGYAPVLTKIPKVEDQDIDVLIYGTPSENRVQILKQLCGQGLRVMFLYGFYGDTRDELIARSKIVLNIGQYDRTFEIVRVSYLMANKKAVVADLYPDITIERDIIDGVMFVGLDQIVPACLHLLANDHIRVDLEERAFASIQKRNIVSILDQVFKGKMIVPPRP